MTQSSTTIPLDFTIGSRRLFAVERELADWAFSLEQVLEMQGPEHLPEPPAEGPQGYRILSAPTPAIAAIRTRLPDHCLGARQDYRRHYIAMEGSSYEDYLASFSSKTRSTLRRKARKLASETGGYSITEHRSGEEVAAFLRSALPLSERTYQARLLGAGIPASREAQEAMIAAGEAGQMRCFLLSVGERPIAYLSLPIEGETLVYAHLGYDPDYARLSPGTVLQLEALERLFAEERFAHFDFTEGEGAHKAMFGTHWVECASFLLLRPTLANRSLLTARSAFDSAVAGAKHVAQRSGALGRIRSALKA